MAKRTYSDEQRGNALAALAANGGNVGRTARDLRIPEATLRQWARGQRHPEAVQMSEQKKGPLADRLEELAHALVDDLLKADGRQGTVQAKTTAIGIVIDKVQLLRGKPTGIHGAYNSLT